jgi:hypothetical protein
MDLSFPSVVEKYNSAFGSQQRGGSTFHSDWRIAPMVGKSP